MPAISELLVIEALLVATVGKIAQTACLVDTSILVHRNTTKSVIGGIGTEFAGNTRGQIIPAVEHTAVGTHIESLR